MTPACIFFLALIIHLASDTDGQITCKNMAGKPVDWFIVYKLPRLKKNADPLIRAGVAFYYMDSESPEWSESKTPINATGHAVEYTLKQIYANVKSKDVMYALYNDQKPDPAVSFSYGHTKGDVCFDRKSGFWLVHSVPRLPPYAHKSYAYPHSGQRNGQTFLCVTYAYSQLDLIGKQLMFNMPWVYDYNMPEDFTKSSPQMALVLQDKHVKHRPWNNSVILQSKGGQKFLSFAKYTKFDADLYDAWVAPYFGSPLYVESWQIGFRPTHSNCTAKFKVLNIKGLQMATVPFKETRDHAKWCVTADRNVPMVCIGDINRQQSQKRRAGGTVCLKHDAVWKAFSTLIKLVEKCKTLTRSDQPLMWEPLGSFSSGSSRISGILL